MKVAILGGGISGLSAAWYLLKKEPNAQVTLFETSKRLGGWIESKEQEQFLFELGPRTFQAEKCTELLQMIGELGLEVVYSGKIPPKFLWHRGALRSISSFWPEIARAFLQDLIAPRAHLDDESIYDFASRRMGKRAAELFFDPIAKGVYGGDIHKLSLRASFPFLFEAEQKERSLVKWALKNRAPRSRLFTLRLGMESLIKALAKLPIEIHLDTPVEKISEEGVFAAGQFWPADLVISALPGLEISRLINIPLTLRNEPITVVNFGYEGDVFSKKGYGYLVPTIEGGWLLGQIWDTSIFPIPGQTKMTSMLRGAAAVEIALASSARLGIRQHPAAILMKAAHIPQYDVGHRAQIEQFEREISSRFQGKLKLTGNYLSGPSVESCLRRSKLILK